jgi:hypothetical protein
MLSAEIKKQGFAVVPELFTHKEIARLDDNLTRNPLPRSRAGKRHALRHPAVLAIARDSRFRAIAQEVLG